MELVAGLLAVVLSFCLGIIAPLAFDFWRVRRHIAVEKYVMPGVEAAMERRNKEMLGALGRPVPVVEPNYWTFGASEISDEELHKEDTEPLSLLEAAMGRDAKPSPFTPAGLPPNAIGLLALCLAGLLSSCHLASVPTEYGTGWDVTLGWPPGNTEMTGPALSMSHNKDAAYGSLNNTIGAVERLAPLAASYMSSQAALQAPRAAPASRPASQPVTIPEFTMLPLPR